MTARKNTMAVIDAAAKRLAAKGSPVPNVPLAPQNPYIHRGKISDPVKAAAWVLAQHVARRPSAQKEAAE